MILKIYLWSVVACAIVILFVIVFLKNSKEYIENDFKGNESYLLLISFIPGFNIYITWSFIYDVVIGSIIEYIHLFYRFFRYKTYKLFKRFY